jgi:hypothetical protein
MVGLAASSSPPQEAKNDINGNANANVKNLNFMFLFLVFTNVDKSKLNSISVKKKLHG